MSGEITREAELFWIAIRLGFGMMLIYDGLRIYRFLVPHRRWIRDVEDVIYWVYCALWAFAVVFKANDGSIRWFYLAGITMGMILWNQIVSKALKKLASWGRMKRKRRKKQREMAKQQ